MKAIMCRVIGKKFELQWETIPKPIPDEDEVLIKVCAASVNFPDVLIVQGLYQFKPELPFSPGGELSGIVEAVGSQVDSIKVGDYVVAMVGWGAFAEKIKIVASKVLPMPKSMDFVSAAAFPMVYGTSYHALKRRARIKAGESILILGASGGVGLAAVQLAKALVLLGCFVIAAASSREKLDLCRKNGADECINYLTHDLRKEMQRIMNYNGVDVVYDPVGGELTEKALRSMAWGGRYLVVGFVGGIPKIPLNLVLLKGCKVIGVFWGSFTLRNNKQFRQDMNEIAEMYKQGKIYPTVTVVKKMTDVGSLLSLMHERKLQGKAVVTTDYLRNFSKYNQINASL